MVARDLADAEARNISPDARYNMAYSAARLLATVIIRANGYRIKSGEGAHHLTFDTVAVAEPEFLDAVDYFDRCRRKRNELLYHAAGVVSSGETEALIRQAIQFQVTVERWLKSNRPALY
jgi:hypothetical protein